MNDKTDSTVSLEKLWSVHDGRATLDMKEFSACLRELSDKRVLRVYEAVADQVLLTRMKEEQAMSPGAQVLPFRKTGDAQ